MEKNIISNVSNANLAKSQSCLNNMLKKMDFQFVATVWNNVHVDAISHYLNNILN